LQNKTLPLAYLSKQISSILPISFTLKIFNSSFFYFPTSHSFITLLVRESGLMVKNRSRLVDLSYESKRVISEEDGLYSTAEKNMRYSSI